MPSADMINIANSLDPDQAGQNVGTDLGHFDGILIRIFLKS